MRVKYFLFVFTCLFLVCLYTLTSAQVTTIDPNAVVRDETEEEDAPENILDADERLDKLVTANFADEKAHKVVAWLASISDVDLKCGKSSSDWLSRERRMNVFVEEVPLRELMRSMARVMRFKWSVTTRDSGEKTYRFVADRKLIASHEKELEKEKQEFMSEYAASRKKVLNTIMQPGDLDKLRKENPYAYIMEKTGIGGFVRDLIREKPELGAHILNGKDTLAITVEDLSASAKTGLENALKAENELEKTFGRRGGRNNNVPADITGGMVLVRMQNPEELWERQSRNSRRGWGRRSMPGVISFRSERKRETLYPLFTPENERMKIMMGLVLDAYEKDIDMRDLINKKRAEDPEFMQNLRGDDIYEPEPLDDAAWMLVPVEFKYEYGGRSTDLIRSFSEVTGQNVVSDSFHSTPAPRVADGEITPKAFLESFMRPARYEYDFPAEIIEMRYHDWYAVHDSQLPDSMLDPWAEEVKKNGVMSMETLAALWQLSREQLSESVSEHEYLGKDNVYSQLRHSPRSNERFMDFYMSLSVQQKAATGSPQGLLVASLSPVQTELFESAVSGGRREPVVKSRPVTIRYNQNNRTEDYLHVQFVALDDAEEVVRSWDFRLPVWGEREAASEK